MSELCIWYVVLRILSHICICGTLWRLYVHIHILPILFACSIIHFQVGASAYKHYQAMNVFVLSHNLIYVPGYGGGC